jgi:hypothetical protein
MFHFVVSSFLSVYTVMVSDYSNAHSPVPSACILHFADIVKTRKLKLVLKL